MARRRSILGDLWLQLSLQAALAVSAASAAEAAESIYTQQAFLSAPADDAFVYAGAALESAAQPPSFEEFSMAFYLPPEPHDPNEYVMLPDLDAALLGGPERNYDWHSDDFLL
jgi:hypothetical protein